MAAAHIFTTEQVTQLIGLAPKKDTWRVIKFAQGQQYGIEPGVSVASGSGTRRLYNLENVCEIAIALRLLEAGLRPAAIGDVLKKLRSSENLSNKLKAGEVVTENVLALTLRPRRGALLSKSRVHFSGIFERFSDLGEQLEEIREEMGEGVESDLLVVFVGPMFDEIKGRLKQMMTVERGD